MNGAVVAERVTFSERVNAACVSQSARHGLKSLAAQDCLHIAARCEELLGNLGLLGTRGRGRIDRRR